MQLGYLIPLTGVLASLLWAYVSFRYYLHYSGRIYTGEGNQAENRRLIRLAQVSLLVSSLVFIGSAVTLYDLSGTPVQPPATVTLAPGEGAGQPAPAPSLVSPPAPTPLPESSPTPEALPASGFAHIGNTSGFGANVRTEPGLAFGVLIQLSDGIRVELTGEVVSADGFIWQRIRLENGQLGWIADNFLIMEP